MVHIFLKISYHTVFQDPTLNVARVLLPLLKFPQPPGRKCKGEGILLWHMFIVILIKVYLWIPNIINGADTCTWWYCKPSFLKNKEIENNLSLALWRYIFFVSFKYIIRIYVYRNSKTRKRGATIFDTMAGCL